VEISQIEGNQSTILGLKVVKPDIGKVNGKKSRNTQAMRGILIAVPGGLC
jgi:predicted RNA-binding protein YlqC (UPF0109 family)